VARHAAQRLRGYREQPAAVYVHEVSAYVHLQHPAPPLAATALALYVPPQAVYAVVGAAPLYAAVGVVDERAFQHLVGVVIVQVVYYAVAECRGKHLALFRVGDDERRGGTGAVGALPQLVTQAYEVAFQPPLKVPLVSLVPLVATCAVISLVQVGQQLFSCKMICHYI